MRADVRVPDLGLEFHVRRPERVLAGNLDIDLEGSSFVWRVRWPKELTSEMCQVIAVPRRLYYDLREFVVLDIGDLFGDASSTVRGHCGGKVVLEK